MLLINRLITSSWGCECKRLITTVRNPCSGDELKYHLLLQLRVLRFGFLQDGNVGVGVFPQREEVLVSGAALDAVTR